ncbi:MAG: MBL fold metallo-hydrolase [Betaproteobacteria bacterium]|nr:MBL fold metallo-hydrolase [Betaproteobacteria bacterium]
MHTELPEHNFHFFERGWLSSNNVLLMGAQDATLVDSGYVTHADQTLALVQSHLKGRNLSHIVNTHLHSDHCGGNARLQSAYPEVQTWIPPGHFEAVQLWDEDVLTFQATGQQCAVFEANHVLKPGTEFLAGDLTWEVHAAPGHDPHSVVLFEPSHRHLISADALWSNGFGVVFPELDGIHAFDEVAATLDLIEQFNATKVFPGHGGAFTDVREAITRARSRLDQFVHNPQKHIAYATKVLLKFKLMEFQALPLHDFLKWASLCPFLVSMCPVDKPDLEAWLRSVLDQLVQSGAARIQDQLIFNT